VSAGGPRPPAARERRRHARVPADLRVRVDVDGRTVEGRTLDISEGGVAMELPEAPLAATGLRIAIELGELGWAEIAGELRRSEPADRGVRLAARFAAAAARGGPAALRAFVDRQLSGHAGRP
jgi:hypothetical protein